jgi:hypothetical protein
MKIIAIIFSVTIVCCSLEPPAEREYIPFEIESYPEERKYYPEETMQFIFNMEVNPETVNHFKVKGVESKLEPEIEHEGKKIIVLPPLPQEDELLIEIGSGLKSYDYKPLFIDSESPSKTGKIEKAYEIGKKIPEMIRFIPEERSSATVGIGFDGEVDFSGAEIDPLPENIFYADQWIVLSYMSPVNEIDINGVISRERESEIEGFSVLLEGGKPQKSDLDIDYFITDESYTVNVSDDSAIAVEIDGVFKICEKKCSVIVEGLIPETKYNSVVTVFASTGKKTEKRVVETDIERPKIMITEIMHTPSKEPEKSWEFVEIYNYGNLDFDLADCFIDDGNNNKGIDPLLLKDESDKLVLKPGDIAIITGNEAAFADLISGALWLVTKDTTIADGGLTSKETVQIKCSRDGAMIIEADEDPRKLSTSRGYSFNVDTEGRYCISSVEGGTPGKLEKCTDGN